MLGAYVLVGLPENAIKAFVTVYLIGMAVPSRAGSCSASASAKRARRRENVPRPPFRSALPAVPRCDRRRRLGSDRDLDAHCARRSPAPEHRIGFFSEFFVTLSISLALLTALDLSQYGWVVLGLIIGGALAAPFAGVLSRVLPPRLLMIMVAVIVAVLAAYSLVRLIGARASG